MAYTNANDVITGLIKQGKLSDTQAHSIIEGAGGYSGAYGGGKVTNFFAGNTQANDAALKALSARGLYTATSLTDQMASTVNNPVLPSGTTLTPQTMALQAGELQQLPTPVVPAQMAPVATAVAPTTIPVAQATTEGIQVDPNAVPQVQAGAYQAVQVAGQAPQAVAQQGQVSELATVQGQLKNLYADLEGGKTPEWAQGAVSAANEVMAARGLGASSIAAGAMTAAIQNSAINIAAADASSYFQMDMKNLDNRQQTALTNLQVAQQALLSDQAAQNAALQFNATSSQQVQEFQAQLVTTIKTQNADRVAAINQFNAAEANKQTALSAQLTTDVSKFNAQQQEARAQFYSNLKYQADAFNANMAQVIDQSNVTWRRNINTANTAAVNAANQSNVQNTFGLSSYALNALWQQSRDEADWLYQSGKDAQDFQYDLAKISANTNGKLTINGQAQDVATEAAYNQMLGQAGQILLSSLLGGK
jgi:hypothetical protein